MPCKWVSLSIGALLENLEGGCLPGLLREKYIWIPFLDSEAIKILSLQAIWNFTKGRALLSLYQIMGHKGTVCKA
jgi:hypothetical protein